MASIRMRYCKDGSVSYQITCCSRDANGNRHSYSRTWKPDSTWTDDQIQRELSAFAMSFECEVKEGWCGMGMCSRGIASDLLTFPTLQTFYERTFRPEKAKLCALNTVLAYDQLERALANMRLWEMPLPAIRPIHIQDFLMTLLDGGLQVSSVNLRRNQ